MSKFKEFCDKIALIKNELEKESLRKANAKSSLMGLAQGLKRKAMSMASPGVIGVHMPSGSPAHPGASQAGADLVTGMKSISSGGTDPLGFKDSAKKKHKQTLIQLQAMPVADLPKSEIQKNNRNVDKRLASRKPQEPYMKESKHLIMGKPTNPKDPINDYEKNGPKKPLAKTDEKYINVGQGWRDLARHKPSGKMVNPITDSGKSKPTHLNDLESLKATHGRNYIEKQSDKPLKIHGTETYKVHPSGELQFVGAHHDSSDGLNAKMNKVEQELKQAKESKSIGALMKVLAKMEDLQQAEDEKLKKNKYIKSILADVKATNARKLGERNIANDAIRAAKPTTVEPKPKVDTSRPTTLFHPDLSFNRKPDTKIQKTFGLAVTSGPDIVNRGTIKTPMQIDSPVIYNDEGKPKMNDVKQFLKDYKNLRGKKK